MKNNGTGIWVGREWVPLANEYDGTWLTGDVKIGGAPFWVVAVRVEKDAEGYLRAVDPSREGVVADFASFIDEGDMATVEIHGAGGGDYVMAILPQPSEAAIRRREEKSVGGAA